VVDESTRGGTRNGSWHDQSYDRANAFLSYSMRTFSKIIERYLSRVIRRNDNDFVVRVPVHTVLF
jgi:hypothetical protein